MDKNANFGGVPSFNVTSDFVSLGQEVGFIEQSKAGKNCILLHGWNSSSKDMERIRLAVSQLAHAAGYKFWMPTYDTNAPFKDNASKLTALFHNTGTDFSQSLVIGYSMGGVVARSMFLYGFNFRSLVTICTPHLGLAPWIPTPTFGTMSIAPWSEDLKNLNINTIEAAKRKDYHFFGIDYNDIRGYHADDAVVMLGSAVGANLGNFERAHIHLTYNGLSGPDPHSRGMDPNFLNPVLNCINRLL